MAQEIPDGESSQSAVGDEVGAEERAGRPDVLPSQQRLQPRGREVDGGDGVADQGQRRPHQLEYPILVGNCEVASLPARSSPQLRQVGRKPLLQLARAGRCDQGRAGRPAGDIDQ
jgi:hypothetical protein